MKKNFDIFMQRYKHRRIAVAVSGGADSMVLMHLVAHAKINAVVLTVDHQLRPTSGAEAAHVKKTAENLGLGHETLTWAGPKPASGVEAAARTARYGLMTSYCRAHKIDVLLLAHHADDQIETFLINLSRGSGVYGLAAMRSENVRDGIAFVRPLLDVPRSALLDYAEKNKIKFFHDDMNDDAALLRVKMRKNRHVLADKLAISDDRILLAVKSLGRVRDMLTDRVDDLIQAIAPENGRTVFGVSFLFDMPGELRLKFISRLLHIIGRSTYPPRLKNVEGVLDKLQSDTILTLNHCVIRRFKDNILIAPEGASVSIAKKK